LRLYLLLGVPTFLFFFYDPVELRFSEFDVSGVVLSLPQGIMFDFDDDWLRQNLSLHVVVVVLKHRHFQFDFVLLYFVGDLPPAH
jgi:hypothetical protein